MTEHTPTPWYLTGSDNATPHIMSDEFAEIYELEHLICVMPAEITQSFNAWENARFIVRAVNSHAALVKALEGLLAGPNWPGAQMTARKAIELAQQ